MDTMDDDLNNNKSSITTTTTSTTITPSTKDHVVHVNDHKVNNSQPVKSTLELNVELLEYINNIRCIDHHCHNILTEPDIFELPLIASMCEANLENDDYFKKQATSTLTYKRTLKELSNLYGIEKGQDIEKKREELKIDKLTDICFREAKIDAIILDDAFEFQYKGRKMPMNNWTWHKQYTRNVYRVIRIETIVEHSLVKAKQNSWSWDNFQDDVRRELTVDSKNPLEQHSGVVGYKSILAYRTGLKVDPFEDIKEQVKIEFDTIIKKLKETNATTYRLMSKPMIDYFLHITMEIAAAHKPYPLPVQIHTGFGDSDLDLEKANPLLLKPIITAHPTVPITLLHCSYPYSREAAFLTWVYPNVYVDIGLAIPSLSISGMRQALSSLLELAPIDKILYSSDSHHIPEIYYLASHWSRKLIHELLLESINQQEIDHQEAKEFIEKIFRSNCIQLYHLE